MQIDSLTALCAVIGYPLKHTLSPAIHNVAYQAAKINAVYLALPIKNLKKSVDAMRVLNIKQYAVTMPYKIEIMKYLDKIDSEAQALGNVNTVINKNGQLIGYNTDIDGVRESLKRLSLKNKKVVVLGAGGVARTIAYAVQSSKFKVQNYSSKLKVDLTILDRNIKKAEKLAKEFDCAHNNLKSLKKLIINISFIVNATPVGMYPKTNQSLVKKEWLKPQTTVFDVVYNPVRTKLIKDARKAGCRVITGETMFVAQAVKQFELLWGKKAPVDVMRKAFRKNI